MDASEHRLPEELGLSVLNLLADMPGGFFVYHADGDEELIYANEACLRIFGCANMDEFKELTGFTFPGMLHPEDLDEVEASIKRQVDNDIHNMDYVEYRIITKGGHVRWIEDWGHYVELDSGPFFYVFISDATEKMRQQMEELEKVNEQLKAAYSREHEYRRMLRTALTQANSANIAKSTFLNNMSHDVRTLLNAVMGYASLISVHASNAEKVSEYAGKISGASEQLLDEVSSTLEVSRMEAGRAQLTEVPCTISDIVSQLYTEFISQAAEAGIAFDVEVGSIRHDEIIADERRIYRMLEQLVDNAVKYSNDEGHVKLHIEETQKAPEGYANLLIEISDDGPGMSADFVEHMFDLFEREHTTTESGIMGTGLGLAIARHTADLMGGRMEVESELGRGTEIRIWLPVKIVEAPQ